MKLKLTSLLAPLLLTLSACSGGGNAQPVAAAPAETVASGGLPGGFAALPPPSSLPREVMGSGETGFYRNAEGWEDALPHANVELFIEGSTHWLTFTPSFAEEGETGFDGLAFTTYPFSLNESDGVTPTKKLRFGWKTAPAAGSFWVGISDFARDRWLWFKGPAGLSALSIAEAGAWSLDGELTAVLAVTGDQPAEFSWMLAGENLFVPEIQASPGSGTGTLNCELRIGDSVIIGAQETHMDIDFEGDGTFDLIDTALGEVNHHYGQHGYYTPALKLYDEQGGFVLDSATVVVYDPNNEPPVAQLDANVISGDAPLFVSFDASGSSDPNNDIMEYRWDFNGDNNIDRVTQQASTGWAFGESGSHTVQLWVADNDLATDLASTTITLNAGFHHIDIDPSIDYDCQVSGAVIGTVLDPRPAVAYFAPDSDELRFSRAVNISGTGWEPPVLVDNSSLADAYPSLCNIFGNPAIAYRCDASGSAGLAYTRASNVNGTLWSPRELIDPGNQARPALRSPFGLPLLLNADQGSGELQFFRGADLPGSSWDGPLVIGDAPPGYEMCGCALSGSPTVPVALSLLQKQSSGDYSIWFDRALNANGTAWEGAQPRADTITSMVSFTLADSRPALAYVTNDEAKDIYFVRTSQPEGSTWDAPVLVAESGELSGALRAAVVGGRPALCWVDEEPALDILRYLRADDELGSSWGVPMPVSEVQYGLEDFALIESAGLAIVLHPAGFSSMSMKLQASVLY